MSIAVDLSNPPPWIVHVGFNEREMTWPFETRDEAEGAYGMAVQSGQFRYQVTRGTKARPAVFVQNVSMWRRETRQCNGGETRVVYEKVEVEP